jgi:hypothetical protein
MYTNIVQEIMFEVFETSEMIEQEDGDYLAL